MPAPLRAVVLIVGDQLLREIGEFALPLPAASARRLPVLGRLRRRLPVLPASGTGPTLRRTRQVAPPSSSAAAPRLPRRLHGAPEPALRARRVPPVLGRRLLRRPLLLVAPDVLLARLVALRQRADARRWGVTLRVAVAPVYILRGNLFGLYGDFGRGNGLFTLERQFAVDRHTQFCPLV